jgi:hypothetical protein
MMTTTSRLWPWFVVSGCIGVIVAGCLLFLASRREISLVVLLALFPTSIAGIVDPRSLSDKILVGAIEFGGNFALYGAIGTLIGLFRAKKSGTL